MSRLIRASWEEENEERKMDYNRANLFIPTSDFTEIEKYNQRLPSGYEKKASELHDKKQVSIRVLFEKDRKMLLKTETAKKEGKTQGKMSYIFLLRKPCQHTAGF